MVFNLEMAWVATQFYIPVTEWLPRKEEHRCPVVQELGPMMGFSVI